MKIGLGAVVGRKSPSPIDKAHGLYNSLYYRTSRDLLTYLLIVSYTENLISSAFNYQSIILFKN